VQDSADGLSVGLAELVATFALGQDNAFGQPLGAQLRSCLIAMRIADVIDLAEADRETVYWVAQLRYVGCSGHAHETAVVFGDEVALRSRSLVNDLTDPKVVLGEIVRHAGAGQSGPRRTRDVLAMLAGGREYMKMNFRAGCEVADALLERLDMSAAVRVSLRHTFERWNGKGLPDGVGGENIPLPMRIVHLSQDMEVIARIRGCDQAIDAARQRRDNTYDPRLVDAFLPVVVEVIESLDKLDPWDAALAAEPGRRRELRDAEFDRALLVAADFVDLKSPYTAGHSRGVAELSAGAATELGCDSGEVRRLRAAGLLHDLGRMGIPNSIWDKPGPLTRSELDRVQLHPLLGEQMLRRSAGLAPLAPIAACHHERLDGAGYAKGLTATALSRPARILAAADRYHAMVEPRAHRPAHSPDQAAVALRAAASSGELAGDVVEAVLASAGHRARRHRPARPAGLTERELDVLRLVARGMSTKQVAAELVISAKTADHHIQHIYAKIGVSTRGAAALFASEHDLLRR
jgi:HD-GYP domain-containing protein (c-di-GMP phosphodiesterase class II)